MADQQPGDMPNLAEMREWRDILIGEWGTLDAAQQEEEDLYFQKFEIDAPGGKYTTKTGSAPSDVDSAVDSLTPSDIIIKVRPARARAKYRDQADKLTRFGRGVLKQWRKRRDPLRLMAADMTIRRLAIARVMLDKSLWPTAPEGLDKNEVIDEATTDDEGKEIEPALTAGEHFRATHRRRFPVILERRNPRYTKFRQVETTGEMLAVVESYHTTVMEARLALGGYAATAGLLKGRRPNERLRVDDIWVGKYRCLLLDDRPLFAVNGRTTYQGVGAHGYSRIPYVTAPFRELPFEEVQKRFRGMLSNAGDLYRMESQALSMQIAMLAFQAWRTYLGHTNDGRDLAIVPGGYIDINEQAGEYLKTLEGTAIPPEVLQTVAAIDAYLQKNSVAQGPSTSEGTRSGQQLWAIQAIRQMKIDSAKQNMIGLVEDALSLAAEITEDMLAEAVTLPVPGKDKAGKDLGEVTIQPSDINGYYEGFEVSFGRRLDPALLEQAKALQALSANNFMPWREAVEMTGLTEVASDWEDELYLQAINRLDFIMELAGIELAKNYYGEEAWQYQALMQKFIESKMQQQQGPPGQTGPGVPPGGGGGIQPPAARGPIGEGINSGGGPLQQMAGRGRTPGPRGPGGMAAPNAPTPGG